MAEIGENSYKKFAEAIADDFVSQDIPLNEGVHKIASRFDMNQEQIKRLCEASNNTVFNKLLQTKKASEDKIVEFDIADPKKVLRAYIKEASADTSSIPETDAMELAYLPNYREDSYEEKTASNNSDFELRPESKPSKEADIRTLLKLTDHLNHEKLAHEMHINDAVSDLTNRFKRLYKDESFQSFEKNAAALYGEKAVPLLNELRKSLRLKEASYDINTLEKTAGFVDDTTEEYQLFKTALDYYEKLNKILSVKQEIESKL